jgi:hypothetical protein
VFLIPILRGVAESRGVFFCVRNTPLNPLSRGDCESALGGRSASRLVAARDEPAAANGIDPQE